MEAEYDELVEKALREHENLRSQAEILDLLEWPIWLKEPPTRQAPGRMLWFNLYAQNLWGMPNYVGKTDDEGWPEVPREITREWWAQDLDLWESGERTRVYNTSVVTCSGEVMPLHVQRSILSERRGIMGFAWNPSLTRKKLKLFGLPRI